MSAALYWSALTPECVLLIVAAVCMLLGVAKTRAVRSSAPLFALLGLAAVLVLSWRQASLSIEVPAGLVIDAFSTYSRMIAAAVGMLIVLVNWHLPVDGERGEFFGMVLCSIAGVMMVAGADDLVTLLFALELVSVPTYVLIALSTNDLRAPESSSKYFFLGAMSAAIMVYGFSFLYGATGTTTIGSGNPAVGLVGYVSRSGYANPLLVIGLVLSVGGIAFKLAAVPFHFYVADVYQGAASPVTGLLGFLPKAAGFIALVRLVVPIGAMEPQAVFWLLWITCAATMTVGNVLALLQRNVKRILAYSSVSHSGYMLIGVLVGTGGQHQDNMLADGVAAMMFYLAVYGVMNLGAFAVLSYLLRRGKPAQELSDLNGLWRSEPIAALALAICVFSLMGFPPTAGFAAKVYVFSGAFSLTATDPRSTALIALAVIGVLNAAVGAVYYLRIVAACYLGEDREPLDCIPSGTLRFSVTLCALISLCFGVWPRDLMKRSRDATSQLIVQVESGVPEEARLASQSDGISPDVAPSSEPR